jgi:HAMP domain-containing protein
MITATVVLIQLAALSAAAFYVKVRIRRNELAIARLARHIEEMRKSA